MKRAGDRVSRFDRKGWLADRERMFRKEMVVKAKEPKISTTPRSAEVIFTQHWASRRFEDVGPKRLLLVLEGGALKIAREEMLASTVLSSSRRSAPQHDFWFAVTIDGVAYLVLHDVPVPGVHGEPITIPGAGDPMVALAPVAERDLAPEVARWKGARVRVDGNCETDVAGFVLISRAVPHFSVVQDWNGTMPGTVPASEATIARTLFDIGVPVVGARLASCSGRYAVPAAAPAAIAGQVITDAKLTRRALAAFAHLPEVAALQKQSGRAKPWWRPVATVDLFRHPQSKETLVSVRANNGGMCGDFTAAVWAIFRVSDSGALEQIYAGQPPDKITAALDLDRDGHLELIVEDIDAATDATLIDPATGPLLQLTHVYNDCPC